LRPKGQTGKKKKRGAPCDRACPTGQGNKKKVLIASARKAFEKRRAGNKIQLSLENERWSSDRKKEAATVKRVARGESACTERN